MQCESERAGAGGSREGGKGKTPTDVWWHTIVPTNGKEKTGYATQKPLGLLERIVKVHSSPGDRLLDFFAGSGTFGEAAAKHARPCLLVDNNPEAVRIMTRRLGRFTPQVAGNEEDCKPCIEFVRRNYQVNCSVLLPTRAVRYFVDPLRQ